MIKLLKFVNLITFRTIAELKSEATRTYAGYLWWILEPLMSLAVYYVAFKYIFHRGTDNFAVFLFSGIVIYRFFAGTVVRSATSIASNQSLMQLVYIHKSLFPLSVVFVNLVKFLVTLMLVIIVVWLSGITPTWSYITIPLLIFLQILLTAGCSMICAAITPFFPDFLPILGTIMHLLIFLSGVFHDINTLSPKAQTIIRLNPIAAMIEQYRMIILHGAWPDFKPLVPAIFESIILLSIGAFLINLFNRHFPKLS
ncbi:MAG: ABC transporter permease [Sedimentisphaerales bacterium]|nr:ABC transporter permease [Sedimentisphaerales bacterium]